MIITNCDSAPGICQPRAFDTHAVSYQNITPQRILLEKQADQLICQGREKIEEVCKGMLMFSILCMHFSSLIKPEWPLCMITSDEQISPPSLVCKESSLHLHSFCVDILFKFTALGHSFMQNFATLQFKTRLGGEICSFDVNMHKGYYIAKLESYRRESTFFGY